MILLATERALSRREGRTTPPVWIENRLYPRAGSDMTLPGRSQGAEAQLSKKDEHVRPEVSVAPICGLRGVEVLSANKGDQPRRLISWRAYRTDVDQ